MYSHNEMINQVASVLNQMDDFIANWEQKAMANTKNINSGFIDKLNKMKKHRFQVKEVLNTLNTINEEEYLRNQSSFHQELNKATKLLDESTKRGQTAKV